MIEVRGLSKAFGPPGKGAWRSWPLRSSRTPAIRAVDNVDFHAEDGAITGLLGPNGAGKTTLLRMLATLLLPDGGSATVDGHDVVREPLAVRRSIGVLSDARGIYARLTTRENVRYFGNLHGLSGAALEARIDDLIGRLGLAGEADRRTQGFSQGERMKVSIARALVHDPQTVLLDEPTNGLDVMSTRAMRELIRGLKAQGKCVVFSSHIMQEVAALCDRIVIIGRGRIVAGGPPEVLRLQAGAASLEDAFVSLLGSGEGLQE